MTDWFQVIDKLDLRCSQCPKYFKIVVQLAMIKTFFRLTTVEMHCHPLHNRFWLQKYRKFHSIVKTTALYTILLQGIKFTPMKSLELLSWLV